MIDRRWDPDSDIDGLLANQEFVMQVARSLAKDRSSADDLAQQSWVAALQNPPRKASSARAWLRRVVQNQARQTWRSDRRRRGRELATIRTGDGPSVTDGIEREESCRVVAEAVESLREPYRTAIVLHYLNQMSVPVMSRRLGVPEETIRWQVKKGLGILRTRLARHRELEDVAPWGLAAPLVGLFSLARRAARWTAERWTGAVIVTSLATIALVVVLATRDEDAPAPSSSSDERPDTTEAASLARDVPSLPPSGSATGGRRALGEASAERLEAEGALAAPGAPALFVRGRVVDDEGPVPHAKVYLGPTRAPAFRSRAKAEQLLFDLTDGFSVVERGGWNWKGVRADEEGRFRFGRTTSWLLANRASRVTVVALHPERGLAYSSGHRLSPGASLAIGNVRLESGFVVSGSVTGEGGAPVVGAVVELVAHEGEDRTARHRMRSDQRGQYRSLPIREDRFSLRVRAPGFVGFESEPRPGGDCTVNVRLRGGPVEAESAGPKIAAAGDSRRCPLAVQVVDAETGAPVTSYRLRIEDPEPARDLEVHDADGRMEIRDLPPGAYSIIVDTAKSALTRRRVELEDARILEEVTLELRRDQGTLRVLLDDDEANLPVGSELVLLDREENLIRSLLREAGPASGGEWWLFARLVPGPYTLQLRIPGLGSTGWAPTPLSLPVKVAGRPRSMCVVVPPGRLVTLALAEDGGPYSIRLLDGEGAVLRDDWSRGRRETGEIQLYLRDGSYVAEIRGSGEESLRLPFEVREGMEVVRAEPAPKEGDPGPE